jgi:hypothetical protein
MLEALTGIDQHQRIPPSPISCLAEKRWISPYPFDKLVPPEKTSRIVECLTSEIAAIIRMAYRLSQLEMRQQQAQQRLLRLIRCQYY